MANGWRVTVFWNAGSYGPGEIWHWLSEGTMGQCAQAVINWIPYRLALACLSYSMAGIRISKEGQPRRAFLLLSGGTYNLEGTTVTMPAALAGKLTTPASEPFIAVLIRLSGSNNGGIGFRNWYCVGAPQNLEGYLTTTGNQPLNVQAEGAFLNALLGGAGNPPAPGFIPYMKNNQWGYLGQSLAAGYLPQPILGITQAAAPSGLIGVVTANANPNAVATNQVHVEHVTTIAKGLPSLNKVWTVASVAPNTPVAGQQTIYLAGSNYLTAANFKQPTGKSTVKLVFLDEFAIVSGNAIKTVSHKRGSGGLRPRGRRLTHL